MNVWLSWSLDGVGSAGEDVEDVEAAVAAVDASVERGRRAFDSEPEWRMLRESADHMQARMRAGGREALDRGRAWSSAIGGVRVRLAPYGGRRRTP